jgi:hypothetical protein
MTARLTPLRAALVALAALAGLFAMHGLTHHGEHLPSHDAAAQHVAGDVMGAVAAPVGAPTADTVPSSHGAMAMCLTILLSGALAWALVRRPQAGLLLRIPHAHAAAGRPRPASRSHDPPTPWSLSVCRC